MMKSSWYKIAATATAHPFLADRIRLFDYALSGPENIGGGGTEERTVDGKKVFFRSPGSREVSRYWYQWWRKPAEELHNWGGTSAVLGEDGKRKHADHTLQQAENCKESDRGLHCTTATTLDNLLRAGAFDEIFVGEDVELLHDEDRSDPPRGAPVDQAEAEAGRSDSRAIGLKGSSTPAKAGTARISGASRRTHDLRGGNLRIANNSPSLQFVHTHPIHPLTLYPRIICFCPSPNKGPLSVRIRESYYSQTGLPDPPQTCLDKL